MEKLSEGTLAAIGRMTVAAVELEHVLAWIGADQAGGDVEAVFGRAGEPLRAARGSVLFAAADRREEYARLVEAAAAQLAISQGALRAMWRGGRADAEQFDEIAAMLLRCGNELESMVTADLGARR
ncbi:hypothetical protein [Actinoplanes sp. NPDC089786]|uniref:hypothetical protein n=1 Tax=Actinoplanes sp. NPDC089786 TaxID=3155185 RepID=UPI0034144F2A